MVSKELKSCKEIEIDKTNYYEVSVKFFKNKTDDFFRWVKGTELVELDDIDVSEDPVRPELTLGLSLIHI